MDRSSEALAAEGVDLARSASRSRRLDGAGEQKSILVYRLREGQRRMELLDPAGIRAIDHTLGRPKDRTDHRYECGSTGTRECDKIGEVFLVLSVFERADAVSVISCEFVVSTY